MMTTRKVKEITIAHKNTCIKSRFLFEIQIYVKLDKNRKKRDRDGQADVATQGTQGQTGD